MPAVEAKDMGELLGVCLDDAVNYRKCAERHNALVKAIKGE